jgi:thymidylate synthase
MLVISANSANELFTATCRAVLATGKPTAPRGIATVEVLGASLGLSDSRRRFIDIPPIRVLNPAFAVAEAMWILSGSDSPWIYQYNKELAGYTDGGMLRGAYGPRLRHWQGKVDQLNRVRELLIRDPDSRRGVVQLFDPSTDFLGYKDVPCTLGYRFFLRDGLLHMHTTMRSQDLWLGFGYDIFTATLIQELLAGWLGAGLGEYWHHVDSLHIYVKDLPAVRHLPEIVAPSLVTAQLAVSWNGLDKLLDQVIFGHQVVSTGWSEIAGMLASYRSWKKGDRPLARQTAAALSGPLATALGRWYDRLEQKSPTVITCKDSEGVW